MLQNSQRFHDASQHDVSGCHYAGLDSLWPGLIGRVTTIGGDVPPCEAAATSRAMEGFLVGMAPDVPCKMLLAPKHGATEGADKLRGPLERRHA